MITIVDYGAGNLRSVANALRALAVPYEIVHDAGSLMRAGKIILPGVGHFGQMMRALGSLQLRETLRARIRSGVPFLGICLGLQALFDSSDEAPEATGLGLFPGRIRRFEGAARVPHMGWNEIEPWTDLTPAAQPSRPLASRLLEGLPARPYVYFAHSYYAPLGPSTSTTGEYGGVVFTASLESENVFAVQFHPEKSGTIGRKVLQSFLEL